MLRKGKNKNINKAAAKRCTSSQSSILNTQSLTKFEKPKRIFNRSTPHGVKYLPHTQQPALFDKYLLLTVILLTIIGLMMVTSASMAISERQYDTPFYYAIHQSAYLTLGLIVAFIVVRIPISFWQKMSGPLLLLGLFLLLLVLMPGIGRQINGSKRWIGFGPIGIQASEFIKLAMVFYMSGYLVRRHDEVRTQMSGFVKPMSVLFVIAILLLLEPDFGATVVIATTVLSMMYLAGVRLRQFFLLLIGVVLVMGLLAIASPYRLLRLTSFLHPWANPFSSGYQLTQSLIAFGHGGLFGAGLGNSIQKLFYLPEAHTDFLFAVLAEELGLVGILFIIGLYIVLVWRSLRIGRLAQLAGQHAAGYMAYGFAVWLGMQAFVNMGVNAGLLPTKGLTLPFISYGGSSMLIIFVVIAVLFRIDYEARRSA